MSVDYLSYIVQSCRYKTLCVFTGGGFIRINIGDQLGKQVNLERYTNDVIANIPVHFDLLMRLRKKKLIVFNIFDLLNQLTAMIWEFYH